MGEDDDDEVGEDGTIVDVGEILSSLLVFSCELLLLLLEDDGWVLLVLVLDGTLVVLVLLTVEVDVVVVETRFLKDEDVVVCS